MKLIPLEAPANFGKCLTFIIIWDGVSNHFLWLLDEMLIQEVCNNLVVIPIFVFVFSSLNVPKQHLKKYKNWVYYFLPQLLLFSNISYINSIGAHLIVTFHLTFHLTFSSLTCNWTLSPRLHLHPPGVLGTPCFASFRIMLHLGGRVILYRSDCAVIDTDFVSECLLCVSPSALPFTCLSCHNKRS